MTLHGDTGDRGRQGDDSGLSQSKVTMLENTIWKSITFMPP